MGRGALIFFSAVLTVRCCGSLSGFVAAPKPDVSNRVLCNLEFYRSAAGGAGGAAVIGVKGEQ